MKIHIRCQRQSVNTVYKRSQKDLIATKSFYTLIDPATEQEISRAGQSKLNAAIADAKAAMYGPRKSMRHVLYSVNAV